MVEMRFMPQGQLVDFEVEEATKDGVTVSVKARLWYEQASPIKVDALFSSYNSVHQAALSSLEHIISQRRYDNLVEGPPNINHTLKVMIDTKTDPWGLKIVKVEIVDVEISEKMQQALEAKVIQERSAKIIEIERQVYTDFNFLKPKGFKVVDVKNPDNIMYSTIILEGKCRLRIQHEGWDGKYISFSRLTTRARKHEKWYDLDILIWYLSGEEGFRKFYKERKKNNLEIKFLSKFLSTYLDEIIELLGRNSGEKQYPEKKSLKESTANLFLDLALDFIRWHRFLRYGF